MKHFLPRGGLRNAGMHSAPEEPWQTWPMKPCLARAVPEMLGPRGGFLWNPFPMARQQSFSQSFLGLSQRLVEGTSVCSQEAAHPGELFLHWSPEISISFSLGTGQKMGTLSSKCGSVIKPAANDVGLISFHPDPPVFPVKWRSSHLSHVPGHSERSK